MLDNFFLLNFLVGNALENCGCFHDMKDQQGCDTSNALLL